MASFSRVQIICIPAFPLIRPRIVVHISLTCQLITGISWYQCIYLVKICLKLFDGKMKLQCAHLLHTAAVIIYVLCYWHSCIVRILGEYIYQACICQTIHLPSSLTYNIIIIYREWGRFAGLYIRSFNRENRGSLAQ